MERRDDKRRARRIPVRFWKRGEEKARSGFTTNISHGGMFIGSNQVFGRGTRLKIEVLDPINGFTVEGVVARANRSQTHMQQFRASGMGIRFLQVGELVEELFPTAQRTESPAPPPVSEAPSPIQHVAPPPRDPAPGPSGAGVPVPEAPVSLSRYAYALQYRTRQELELAYERDISQGGLFITTPSPAPLQEVVVIEIQLQSSQATPVRLRAKVVHCIDPQSTGEANLLAGMGLELLDPEKAKQAVQHMLTQA